MDSAGCTVDDKHAEKGSDGEDEQLPSTSVLTPLDTQVADGMDGHDFPQRDSSVWGWGKQALFRLWVSVLYPVYCSKEMYPIS